jgi:hypothetical protein
MNSRYFDGLICSLVASRRALFPGMLAMAAGWVGVSTGEAKKKHKHKAKKANPNEFGCISVGKTCKNAEQCCSGACEGKKGKKRCRAHDTGTCDQNVDGICEADDLAQTLCGDTCACIRTTAGSNVCFDPGAGSDCADCQKDADCQALGFPAGSACAPSTGINCAGACESGMLCAVPCGVAPPES